MTVTFYGLITRYTGGEKSYTPEVHSTVRGLLDELGGYYGDDFIAFVLGNETCIILINGKGIMLTGGLDSALQAGDKIDILPFVDAG